MAEQEIRSAAEALLTGSLSSLNQSRSHSTPNPHYSINTQAEHLSSTDLVTGIRQDGRMSVVRRFFCLFVTFDLLFTVLMWLICIMLTGDEIFDALSKQIIHYNIHTSLFDIVMAAASRFVVLLLFYGLLYIRHWCVIAISTAGTCAFLIAKVFLYNWATASSPVFQVLLVLTSFVLAWGEAWFLDFRVLPQEAHALAYMQVSSALNTERTPLLRNFLQGLQQPDECTESVGNFYSPLDSPEGSDTEEQGTRKVSARGNVPRNSVGQESEYKRKAHEIVEAAWNIVNLPDWKLEKTVDDDTVHSRVLPKQNKVFRLTGVVDLPPKALLYLLFESVEQFPSWNPTVLQSHRVQVIDERTDVIYQVVADGAGGVFSSRDFVLLRNWNMKNGCYVVASASVTHPSIPKHNKYIRGENGPSCWVIQPAENNRCICRWLLNTNLNGWIPQYLLDTAFTTAMCDYMQCLRSHILKMKSEDNLSTGVGE
ncbi:steroidogenic acute regulatory protein-like [Schistocerca cancellata]|uniref:steroidogenic acute regulatory protein-like n=1 Tax=Schistocerca cancellata TaxID=274614 RepID=UPI0021177612|nr:steroidogenic acute regulatory protein-like [Schistocerca cancellata]XP_049782968.1 steroidogenic acute regulatory protein-like [Schistocerca cancellata]XP_049782969.1 steroidogenic acute regulatory protein-like [Schistocerca cancellata]